MSWPWPHASGPVVAWGAHVATAPPLEPPLPTLSARLNMAAALARNGSGVADIGTDHAQLPVAMVRAEWARSAVAIDCAAGPLTVAERSVKEACLADRISVRLGSGLDPLAPDEAETVVIAGVGGRTAISVLDPHRLDALNVRAIVVQPNRDDIALRAHLDRIGWRPTVETLVYDAGRFFYTVAAERGTRAWSSLDFWLGPYLRHRQEPLARAFRDVRRRYLMRHPDPSREVSEVLQHIERLDRLSDG